MLRFIDLRGQITFPEDLREGEKDTNFAIWNTVTGSFCTFDNTQCWDNIAELCLDIRIEKIFSSDEEIEKFIQRVKGIIPEDFFSDPPI